MKDSLVCHALCSDPTCESEHASQCVVCGSLVCYRYNPVCDCSVEDAGEDGLCEFGALMQEYLTDEQSDSTPRAETEEKLPQRFQFRFTFNRGAK
jgi:hypothetical protein